MKSFQIDEFSIKGIQDKSNVASTSTALRKTIASLLLIILASCGSNQTDTGDIPLSTGISPVTESADFGKPASPDAIAPLIKELASYFNGQYASNPEALMGAGTPVNKQLVTGKAIASSNIPKNVFRFYNTTTGTHFFTISVAERDYVRNSYPSFAYEGSAFFTYPIADPALSPVFRFYNKITGTHFYTINAAEKAHVIATWPDIFNYEGIAWYASTVGDENSVPIYRFFNTHSGTHFYTTSASEANHIIDSWEWFSFEGVAYYVAQGESSQPTTTPPVPVACIPPACYPPAARPVQSNSKNVFWLRTDSSKYEFLTANQLIYSERTPIDPTINSYDGSIHLYFEGNEFFIKPGVTLPAVYRTDYTLQNVIDSDPKYSLGLNKYATRHGGLPPALDVSTAGRGCNISNGAFYIHELEAASDGRLIKFSVDFKFNCDGNEGVNGAIRFNSNIPSVVTQIFAVAGSDFAVQEGMGFPLLGNLSWSPSSKIKTAQWTQISGPALDLSQCDKLTCQTYAPLVPSGGGTARLRLTVESESGLVGIDTVNVEIRSNLDKQTRLDVWGSGFAAGAVGNDLHLNDIGGRMQIPNLGSLGSIYQDQTSERVHIIAKGRTQNGGSLLTGVNMEFMSKAGEPLVPGQYEDPGTGGGYEPFPDSASVNVSANGAACGHSLATMYVGEIQRDELDYGNISSLAILTQSNCIDAGLDEATYTRLWINHQPANIPVAHITGPTQASAGQKVILDSNASFAMKGMIVNKVWRIVSSTAEVNFSNAGNGTIDLNFGANSPLGSKVVVSLEAFDTSGDSKTTLHTVTVQ